MKALQILAITVAAAANAGSPAPSTPQSPPAVEPFLLTESAFSFDAGYKDGGHGSAWEWRAQAGVLLPLQNVPLPGSDLGEWKVRLGVDWHRFEFDHSSPLPLPDRLQSVSAIIGLELHTKARLGALLQVRPGVYFEDDAGADAWNFPVRFGVGYDVNERFALALMGRYDGFAKYPFLGGVGFVWKINDTVTLSAIAPEPRITWQASEQLAVWAGGEFAGGAYRTQQLGSAVVDYTDYRVYLGSTWKAGDWQFEAVAGASLEREWDYHRADTTFKTNEASPFLKFSIGTKW